jgi:hypothetical protein
MATNNAHCFILMIYVYSMFQQTLNDRPVPKVAGPYQRRLLASLQRIEHQKKGLS